MSAQRSLKSKRMIPRGRLSPPTMSRRRQSECCLLDASSIGVVPSLLDWRQSAPAAHENKSNARFQRRFDMHDALAK